MKITRSIKPLLSLSLPILALTVFASCEDETDPQIIENRNVIEVASANSNFSVLVGAVQTAGLEPALTGAGPVTLFAPNNEAFGRYLTENSLTEEDLLASGGLETVLNYHVVNGDLSSENVGAGEVSTAATVPFYVSIAPDDQIWINGSTQVIQTDIDASNGVIHVLDNVIVPPSQNISEILGGYTTADTPEFTQLVAALTRANLVDTFTGGVDDDYTVFAPNDAAFQELYATLGVTGVDQIPVERLTEILQYHVINQRAFSQDLRQDGSLTTLLEDGELSVNLEEQLINEAALVEGGLNIHATNGVIHQIDSVLIPE
jgi:uncharacterized surface protein with fasciclin (FAS1) repeats